MPAPAAPCRHTVQIYCLECYTSLGAYVWLKLDTNGWTRILIIYTNLGQHAQGIVDRLYLA